MRFYMPLFYGYILRCVISLVDLSAERNIWPVLKQFSATATNWALSVSQDFMNQVTTLWNSVSSFLKHTAYVTNLNEPPWRIFSARDVGIKRLQ